MKLLLSIALTLVTFGSFASNKICVGEKIIVVFNENLKKLSVLDKETMEILQWSELEGESFGEIALSSNESKIWFETSNTMYCRDVKSGEIVKEIPGNNAYIFELNDAHNHLVHFERAVGEKALIYVYDLNSAEAISYAKVDFPFFVETIHYDQAMQQFHLLSQNVVSKTEKKSKEPAFGLPESTEQIALSFEHDQLEKRYMVFDITNKKVLYDEFIPYSPNSECNFELINEKLYVVTGIGTVEVLEDFSFQLTDIVSNNLADYDILDSELFGVNGYALFSHSFETGAHKNKDDFEVNPILLNADALAVTESHYYCIKEGIFYRMNRKDTMGIDFETSLE